jgi:hypothetical protein
MEWFHSLRISQLGNEEDAWAKCRLPAEAIPVVLNSRPQSSATCGEFSPCSIPEGEFIIDFIGDTT